MTPTTPWPDRLRSWMCSGSFWGQSVRFLLADPTTAALTVARVLTAQPGPVVVVAAESSGAERLALALRTYQEILGDERELVLVPEVSGARNQWVPEHEAARCAALDLAVRGSPVVFVVSALALLAQTVAPEQFRERTFELAVGTPGWSPETLARRLTELDYDNEYEVHVPGEFSRRGGILDLYSPGQESPARIEFFGDTIDSIRLFDPDTQRSSREISSIRILPRGETAIRPGTDTGEYFWDFLRPTVPLVVCEPPAVQAHIEQFAGTALAELWSSRLAETWRRFAVETSVLNGEATAVAVEGGPVDADAGCLGLGEELGMLLPELGPGGPAWHWQQLLSHLKRWHRDGVQVVACCGSDGEATRLRQRLAGEPELATIPVAIEAWALDGGVLIPGAALALLSEKELFARRPEGRRRRLSRYHVEHALREGVEIEEGRHAVHASHGVCIYRGICSVEVDGQTQEAMDLEFDAGSHLYVPLDQAHLVSRYVGGTKKLPKLSRLGGAGWKTAKAAAEAAATDLAAELLRIEAVRHHATGVVFRQEPEWETAFSRAFPYDETEDQTKAIQEVLDDMARPQPMDRLLCGDVGYGKTEVAMRAAFRSVVNGKQVALLVPTTVLAQQHYLTFRERLADYPVRIEMLSRFRTRTEQERVIQDLALGRVDIVIGTHRLLGGDIVFHDLGLVIVDEEQRFGVKHKEKFKHLRASVDVLTMTATPIPRTLYFSLAGLRNLSTIMTSPADRLPITTTVAQASDKLVREAILRELERRGQVFLLHNRVQSIGRRCERLQQLVPEARFGIAHGQMPAAELEEVMTRFVLAEIDVLVCTTIIESGLDIQNANTIIIDRADRFGLAELYQLRGRVGRYHRQAYAYLLLPPMGALPANARDRLVAIRRYTHLGAGFKLALRDLEIRGAGNILGTEQSGHIAAVGFELYCQLLREAVRRLSLGPARRRQAVAVHLDFLALGTTAKAGKLVAAVTPEYVGAEPVRLECYRRLNEVSSEEEIDGFTRELSDRFGPPPGPVLCLLDVARLRVAAARLDISAVIVRQGRLFLQTARGYVRDRQGEIPQLTQTDPQAQLGEVRDCLERLATTGHVDPAPETEA